MGDLTQLAGAPSGAATGAARARGKRARRARMEGAGIVGGPGRIRSISLSTVTISVLIVNREAWKKIN